MKEGYDKLMTRINLLLASIWTPNYFIKRELQNISKKTMEALQKLIERNNPNEKIDFKKKLIARKGGVNALRRLMSENHNYLVKILVDNLGKEKAIQIGRKQLYETGVKIGLGIRKKLKIGKDEKDLFYAAKILYKILGISFSLEKQNDNIILIVDRCFLSDFYNPETCNILSATDEGVVHGLNPYAEMKFSKRITEGLTQCVATIKFRKGSE
jgi:hypothetical protein